MCSTLYEAADGNEVSLQELIETNPLLASIEGMAYNAPIEEVKQKEEAEKKKMEDREQDMANKILDEGGNELGMKDIPHIQSATERKVKEEEKKAKGIHKAHKDKMDKILKRKPGGKGRLKREMNSNFFTNAKAPKQKSGAWAVDFDAINENEFSVTTAEQEAKDREKRLKEEKLREEKRKTIKESDILAMDQKNKEKFLTEGEYVYELFAILVHSGGAYEAHYFAYVKDPDTESWISYNDATARPIRISEIQRVFGGYDFKSTLFDNLFLESVENNTNAYMLMYRKVGLPVVKVDSEEIPDYLLEEIEKEDKEAKPEVAVRSRKPVGDTG
eukprot:TRINITY_DN1077_c0_g1_i11.p1 TRINITY_DN1077_c0_g1~~TRINITY_DN1077_c0_g1_i11.p1  ORF type:complete len:331 (+),score=117.77 TRINITY_DN1077_c0_g1_i11:892-1884(+)